MQFESEVLCFGIKESKGEIEGRAFSSTTFHLETTLSENNAGRSLGIVTRPFKHGDASEFEKWAKLPKTAFPYKVQATFVLTAGPENSSVLKLVAIRPASQAKAV